MKSLILNFATLISSSAFAAAQYPRVTGDLALKIYGLACNAEPCADMQELSGACYYGGPPDSLSLRFCMVPEGHINQPLLSQVSDFILQAGLPVVRGDQQADEWIAGYRFTCTRSQALCNTGDFK